MCEVLKMELEVECCCVCGADAGAADLSSPEEYDAGAPPHQAPLRAMLLHLNNNKVVPNGRLCSNCIRRTLDAYNFSSALASKGPPPLSEKIRALRNRLHELTQKIDVFIVVGGGTDGAYSEQDIIMVERLALGHAAHAPGHDARGAAVYQCSVCPLTFTRLGEYRVHMSSHAPDAVHTCWSCGARLASAADLTDHLASHAPAQDCCTLCGTQCQSSAKLREHEASCPSVCPVAVCGVECASRAALSAHATSHAAMCAQCYMQFDSPEQKAAHVLHHRRDKHFVCGYKACILRFNTRSDLMSHIRKCHVDERTADLPAPAPATAPASVACPHCPRTFGSQAAMKRHARTHQNKHNNNQDMDWTDGEKVEYLEVETLEELDPDDPSSNY